MGEDCNTLSDTTTAVKQVKLKTVAKRKKRDDSDGDNSTDSASDNSTDTTNDKSDVTLSENNTTITSTTNTTEKQKLEMDNIVSYSVGSNKARYYATNDCRNNCTNRGRCLNSTCFCEQGYTSRDCSMTYSKYLTQGYKFSSIFLYLIIVFVAAMIATLIYLIIKGAKRVDNDYLRMDG